MKKILLLFTLLFFLQIGYGKDYKVGDLLKVFPKNGLFLRAEKDIKSERVVKIKYGQEVEILDIHEDIIMDSRPGAWLKVKGPEGEEGFVFDAYLSDFPVPTKAQVKIGDFYKYILTNFSDKPKKRRKKGKKKKREKKDDTKVKLKNGITILKSTDGEKKITEIKFDDIRYGELITLVELFYREYPKATKIFFQELIKSHKKDPNALRIPVLDENHVLFISNGEKSKSVTITKV